MVMARIPIERDGDLRHKATRHPPRLVTAGWVLLPPLLLAMACQSPTDAPPVTPDPVPVEVIIPSVPCATDLGTFGGLQWKARTQGMSGPGPNLWSACNAWLDSAGMHLRVSQRDSGWTSAEVYTSNSMGYGRFEFEISTRLDALDRNVVLGLFTYPGGGLDGQHEIDVEVSKFGATAVNASNLTYAVYPATAMTTTQGRCALRWDSPASVSVHRFLWSATSVAFQSFATKTVTASTAPYRAWSFKPTGTFAISSGSWPLRMNLWLFSGHPPTNGAPLEIVISKVTYSSTLPTTPTPSTACQ